jgi:hypothetical protein
MIPIAVFRLCGQVRIDPSGVAAQFWVWISAPNAPPLCRQGSSGASFIVMFLSCRSQGRSRNGLQNDRRERQPIM